MSWLADILGIGKTPSLLTTSCRMCGGVVYVGDMHYCQKPPVELGEALTRVFKVRRCTKRTGQHNNGEGGSFCQECETALGEIEVLLERVYGL